MTKSKPGEFNLQAALEKVDEGLSNQEDLLMDISKFVRRLALKRVQQEPGLSQSPSTAEEKLSIDAYQPTFSQQRSFTRQVTEQFLSKTRSLESCSAVQFTTAAT